MGYIVVSSPTVVCVVALNINVFKANWYKDYVGEQNDNGIEIDICAIGS